MRLSLIITLCSLTTGVARADNWPAWRGPNHDGTTSEKNLPVEWSTTKNLRWKAPLKGAGASSPIVWNEFVFLTASEGRLNDQLFVYCYHRDDGRVVWQTRLLGSAPTDLYPPGGMAVPTPVTDGRRLFVLFGTGDLACLDFEGKPLWIRSLAEEYGPFRNRWGMATSPILVEDSLIVQVDHWSESYLLAIDPATGGNRWKTLREASVNWSTPLPVRLKDRTQLVTCGSYFVRGYDAKTGTQLWWTEGLGMQCIPTAVVEKDSIIASSGESTLAIHLDRRTGDVSKSNIAWTNKKANAFIPSPLVRQGLVYVSADKGIVTCLDVRTGKQVWKERLGEEYHASPVSADEKIYFVSKQGVTHVIRAGRTFELLAENDLGETVVASPALSNGRIYIRGDKHLFCVGN